MDLTLPTHCPEVRHYRQTSSEGNPFALYTLIETRPEDLEAIRKLCVSMLEDWDSAVQIPPQHRFIGGPLQAVLDQHLALGLERKYDPCWFIVVTTKDWETEGLLIVGLDTSLEDGPDGEWPDPIVDSGYFKAEETGMELVNLQSMNIEWIDAIEKPLIPLHGSAEGSDRGLSDA